MLVKIDIDHETYDCLVGAALSEQRPLRYQAAVELRRAMGLPFPQPLQVWGKDLKICGSADGETIDKEAHNERGH